MKHQSNDASDIFVPRSQFYHGPYGRMFRNLPAHVPTLDLLKGRWKFIVGLPNVIAEPLEKLLTAPDQNACAEINKLKARIPESNSELIKILTEAQEALKDTEAGREAILKLFARTMIEPPEESSKPDDPGDNPDIPAGYSYFLQFITHDITFDPTSSLMRFNDPDKLRNFRTPRLDLDSLYGRGPDDSRFLYDKKNPEKFLIGATQNIQVRVAGSIVRKRFDELKTGDEVLEIITENKKQYIQVRVAGSITKKRFDELEAGDEVLEIITENKKQYIQVRVAGSIARKRLNELEAGDEVLERIIENGQQYIQVRVADLIARKRLNELEAGDEVLERIIENGQQYIQVKVADSIEKKRFDEPKTGDEVLEIITENREDDLPRNSQGHALIGDPRNDENVILSQLHLAFIKFHNKILDEVIAKGLKGNQAFQEAQRLVRWHYQWVILHDLLPKFVDAAILSEILGQSDCPTQPKLCYYQWHEQPFIPVEFSVAAFRFGHSMIRDQYNLNFNLASVPIVSPKTGIGSLQGFDHLKKCWTIQWDIFFKIKGSSPQKSRKIDTKLSFRLGTLISPFLNRENVDNLAARDLIRGYKMGLPSGQTVARAMGEKPLDGPEAPLWYYILREAEERRSGCKLGPVGGRIVAEVIIGLLAGDPHSFLNVDRGWQPLYSRDGKFELQDILAQAKVPLTEKSLRTKFEPLGCIKNP